MESRLFVYGTLAPGQQNEHVLEGLAGTWQPAYLTGDLVASGWGTALGFPALTLRDDGPRVAGLLFSSGDLPRHWDRLDDFEGPGYDRVIAQVTRDDGEVVTAYVYAAATTSGEPSADGV